MAAVVIKNHSRSQTILEFRNNDLRSMMRQWDDGPAKFLTSCTRRAASHPRKESGLLPASASPGAVREHCGERMSDTQAGKNIRNLPVQSIADCSAMTTSVDLRSRAPFGTPNGYFGSRIRFFAVY